MVPFFNDTEWITIANLLVSFANLTDARNFDDISGTKVPSFGILAHKHPECLHQVQYSGPWWLWWFHKVPARIQSIVWRIQRLALLAVERFALAGMLSSTTCRHISWDKRSQVKPILKRRPHNVQDFFHLLVVFSRLCQPLDQSIRWDSIHVSLSLELASILVDYRARACLVIQP